MKEYIAIYSRKSKFTGTGESIENQIEMCKNYLIQKFGSNILDKIKVFIDEGFTGANTNRPEFQKMIQEFKSRKYKMLIVYKLDRISRNVLDFCSLKDYLATQNIDFISITENFDTSTPLGSAMLMISSVFAQLERDTIAERIKDNMNELAKTGRWLGGTTPFGYNSKMIEIKDEFSKKRKYYELEINEDEIKVIKLIFTKFQEFHSLLKLEKYLTQKNIKTRNNIYFSKLALKNILTNPVYCQADEDIKKYFKENNLPLYQNEYSSKKNQGLITYNKRIQTKTKNGKIRKNQLNPLTKWTIAVGNHQGIISGKEWLKIQEEINQRPKTIKKSKQESLFSKYLICHQCGSFLKAKILKTTNEQNQRNFTYICEQKLTSHQKKCNCPNLKGIPTDNLILTKIKTVNVDNSILINILKNYQKELIEHSKNEYQDITKKIKSNQEKIKNLRSKIPLIENKYLNIILEEIKTIENNNHNLEAKIKKDDNLNLDIDLKNLLKDPFLIFNELDIKTKRDLIETLNIQIIYDKTILKIVSRSNP